MLPALPTKLEAHELPRGLSRLGNNPLDVYYLTGELPPRPWVAIVGTRAPTREGCRFAFILARRLSEASVSVLSGGAIGIDAAAHLGALRAGGRTLVVAPSGWLRPSPVTHHRLFRSIVERGGGHLSLSEPEQVAARWTFLRRNRCMVAMADAAVVVEAPLRSGARNAAASARKLGTKLFVVPSAPWSPKGRGCLAELRAGATLLESHADVLRYLEQKGLLAGAAQQLSLMHAPTEPDPPSKRAAPPANVGAAAEPAGDAARVMVALRQGARHVAEVCAYTGLDVPRVQNEIFTLRLQGVVHVDPTGTLSLLTA